MSNDRDVLRNPTALLVLRVWMERGAALPMRAYIRRTADTSLGFQQTSIETDLEAAVSAVRTWLQGLIDADPAGAPPNGQGFPAEGSADAAAGHPAGDGPVSTNGADAGQ
jgi:hypothetical protein